MYEYRYRLLHVSILSLLLSLVLHYRCISATLKESQKTDTHAVKVTHSRDLHHPKHFQDIYQKYRFHKAKKQGAVKEAVQFLMKQQSGVENAITSIEFNSSHVSTVSNNQQLFQDITCTPEKCPMCQLSYANIGNEGIFVYLGDDYKPPYDYTCFSMRIRYHTANICEKKEEEQQLKLPYKWKFMLQSALNNKCIMPSLQDLSPPRALAAHYSQNNIPFTNKSKKVILMLGLSFMGEPFMALGCLFPHLLVSTAGGAWGNHVVVFARGNSSE